MENSAEQRDAVSTETLAAQGITAKNPVVATHLPAFTRQRSPGRSQERPRLGSFSSRGVPSSRGADDVLLVFGKPVDGASVPHP